MVAVAVLFFGFRGYFRVIALFEMEEKRKMFGGRDNQSGRRK
jgi:hypothetical protein